ncbi:MAG: 23S rRNA (guanosine(2251)-2'-O)-methyltransferase RlmB, partial [Bacteroidota bacterium]
ILQLAKKRNVYVARVPLAKLNKITRKNHQGALAFLSVVNFVSLANVIPAVFEAGKNPLILVLDRVTDVRNFGAICRSAECAGVHAVVIPKKGTVPINQDAMKTSSGALNFLSICKEDELKKTLHFLRESGLHLIACTEKTDTSIYDCDFSSPTAIVMGSEEDGIRPELIEICDQSAKIPLRGQVSSLNVSVATGVIIYEAIRQRNID